MGKIKLNIVVSCVANKSLPIPSGLEFRNISLDTIPVMADRWIEKLGSVETPIIEASKLYSGAAWKTILSAQEVSNTLKDYDINYNFYIKKIYDDIKSIKKIQGNKLFRNLG